nr:hypothetical protein [Mucilaginibacter sp. X5P1]
MAYCKIESYTYSVGLLALLVSGLEPDRDTVDIPEPLTTSFRKLQIGIPGTL